MNAGPGDLVVCVRPDADDIDTQRNPTLVSGRAYRVERVGEVANRNCYGLGGLRDTDGIHFAYCSHRFRKLNDEPERKAIVEQIKSCKPVPSFADLTESLTAWDEEFRALVRDHAEYVGRLEALRSLVVGGGGVK